MEPTEEDPPLSVLLVHVWYWPHIGGGINTLSTLLDNWLRVDTKQPFGVQTYPNMRRSVSFETVSK